MKLLDAAKDGVILFSQYVRMTIKIWFEYKVDAVLRSLAVFLRESTSIIVIYLSLLTFGQINGWNINELFFLFSFVFMTYGAFILVFTGLRDFEYLVRAGELDRFLLRPRGVLLQIIVWDADYFAAIGQGGLGLVLFLCSALKVGVPWTPANIAFCLLSVMGGVLIHGALFLVMASANIMFIKTGNLKELFYSNAKRLSGYPISIYPRLIQGFMMFVVPFAFVNYFPCQYFLRKQDLALFWPGFTFMTPIIGLVSFSACFLVWRRCLAKYASTGS